MGATLKGFALHPLTEPSLFEEARVAKKMESQIGDIREQSTLTSSMRAFNPDILIHVAAQPLVQVSYRDPIETYSTNVMGTIHVLEAAKKCPNLKAIVNVTSDKCYQNSESKRGYSENDPMGGDDPYSSSKGCAELVTSSWRKSFFNEAEYPLLASARAGNVMGGGDWSEYRLLPDIFRALEKNTTVAIRNPHAIRPWQHVLEPLSGYLVLAEKLYQGEKSFAHGWNFGPNDDGIKPVEWVVKNVIKIWDSNLDWKLDQKKYPREANTLALDISLAKSKLHWQPTWSLPQALENTVSWQQAWHGGDDAHKLCLEQIRSFEGNR